MEKENHLAIASITIDAPADDVWNALTDPKLIKQYMFGTDVVSDWEVGSSIIWQGEWEGRKYEDKGEILAMEENRKLQFSHLSPSAGEEDKPENYRTVTIELSGDGTETTVTLTQDNNADEDAKAKSEQNWNMMLEALKKLLEKS